MNADRIYADPSTITGSIGIFGMIPNLSRSLDKIGVHTDGVGTTRFAGAFDITRPMDPAVGGDPVGDQQGLRRFHRQGGRCTQQAGGSGGRSRPRSCVERCAGQGTRPVDAWGLKAAIADASNRAKLGGPDKVRVRYIEKPATPFAQFLSGFAGSHAGARMLGESGVARMMLARSMPEVDTQLRFVEDAARDPRGSAPVKALAYCFCGF